MIITSCKSNLLSLLLIVLLSVVAATVPGKPKHVDQLGNITTQHRRTGILNDWMNREIQAPKMPCVNTFTQFIAAINSTTTGPNKPRIVTVCSRSITILGDKYWGIDLSNRTIHLRCNRTLSQRCQLSGNNNWRIFYGNNISLTATKFDFVDAGNGIKDSYNEGGFFDFFNSFITLTDCTFKRNSGYYGGAVTIADSTIVLKGNTLFENNIAFEGGAMALYNSKLIATNGTTTFTSNYAWSLSALKLADSTANLKEIRITNNTATTVGTSIVDIPLEKNFDGSCIFLLASFFLLYPFYAVWNHRNLYINPIS
jgi:hypothetical protein